MSAAKRQESETQKAIREEWCNGCHQPRSKCAMHSFLHHDPESARLRYLHRIAVIEWDQQALDALLHDYRTDEDA